MIRTQPTPSSSRIVQTQTLFMPGKPRTRHEPLLGPRGPYPHPKTVAGMREWQALWFENGRLYVEGPILLEVYARVVRPVSHLNNKGVPNATGRKYPVPPGFDLSNIIKLAEDALKNMAFGDDSLVAVLHARKTWSPPTRAGVEVAISAYK